MNNKKAQRFAIKSFESLLVIAYILFEELVWNVFSKPVYLYFKSLIALESLKKIFLAMNRHLLLTLFIFILAITEALGFFSGLCIVNGYFFSGMIVYASKIPIAAFTFWLFDLTKEKLMTFEWLKSSYEYILEWISKFVNSSLHIYIKDKIVKLRTKLKQLKLHYFNKESFMASIKKHYSVFKPFVSTMVNKWSLAKR